MKRPLRYRHHSTHRRVQSLVQSHCKHSFEYDPRVQCPNLVQRRYTVESNSYPVYFDLALTLLAETAVVRSIVSIYTNQSKKLMFCRQYNALVNGPVVALLAF